MFNRRFFNSKLGQASIASVAAMVAMVIVSSQITTPSAQAAPIAYDSAIIEIA
ncbi:MAG: hypothetical protein AAF687_02065 [Pseudomonadota bacterium]